MSYTGTNFSQLSAGLDTYISTIDQAISNQVFKIDLPFVGQLKNSPFSQSINRFRSSLKTQISTLGDSPTPQTVQQVLFNVLGSAAGGLGLLQDLNGDRNITIQDVQIVEDVDNVRYHLKLQQSSSLFTTPLLSNLGLPNLGLSINGAVDFRSGYTFDLNFGISKTKGFYIETSNLNELLINLDLSKLSLDANGKLGIFKAQATDQGTKAQFNFAIDIKNSTALNNQLTVPELQNLGSNFQNLINTNLDGGINLKLNLQTGVDNAKFNFLALTSDFSVDWQFSNSKISSNSSSSIGGAPKVAFTNVKLDLSALLGNFVSPVLKEIQQITEPARPVIDLLTKPLPVLSDFAKKDITLLDIAQIVDPKANLGFIKAWTGIASLAKALPADKESLLIDVGSFDLGQLDVRASNFSLKTTNPNITKKSSSIEQQVGGSKNDSMSNSAAFLSKLKDNSSTGQLKFELLDDPTVAFKLLLGQEASLFSYKMPALSFNGRYTQFIPILGPLGVEIVGNVGAAFNFEFGYDTFGLSKFATTKSESDLSAGFYVNAQASSPPNIRVYAGLDAGPGVNIAVASFAITGGIVANIDFRLRDNNNDGKVRFDEITANAQSNPLNLFTTGGALIAGLNARASIVGIPYETQIASTTLLDYGGGTSLKSSSKQGNRLGQAILLGLLSPAAAIALGAGSAIKLTSETLKEVGKWSVDAWNTIEDGGGKSWQVLKAGGENLFKALGQFDSSALKIFKNLTSKFTEGANVLVENGLIKLTRGLSSVSQLVNEFDIRNPARFVEKSFTSGVETLRSTFDEAGKLVEKIDFLPDGRQIQNLYNSAGNYLRNTFDKVGKLAEKIDFLPDGRQIQNLYNSAGNYLRNTFDKVGKLAEKIDFLPDGRQIQNLYNSAGNYLRNTFDKVGKLAEKIDFLPDGRQIQNLYNSAGNYLRNTFDKVGKLAEKIDFLPDGRQIQNLYNSAGNYLRNTFDKVGKLAEKIDFLPDGRQIQNLYNSAGNYLRNTFDKAGKLAEKIDFLPDGRQIQNLYNSAGNYLRNTFDKVGKLAEKIDFLPDGRQIQNLYNSAGNYLRNTFDKVGKLAEKIDFLPDGRQIQNLYNSAGNYLRNTFDKVGKLAEKIDFLPDGRQIQNLYNSAGNYLRNTFDKAGKLAEKIDFLPDGRQIQNLYNSAGNYLRNTFDKVGKLAEKIDFLPDGRQIQNLYNSAGNYLRNTFDKAGKLAEKIDFLPDGRQIQNLYNSAGNYLRNTFDKAGKLAEKIDFLPDGRQIQNLYNSAGNYLRNTFDKAGKLAEKINFLPDGGQIESYFRNGSEYFRKTFKANGEYVEDAWDGAKYLGQKVYNAAGKLIGGAGDFFRGIGGIFS